MLGQYGGMVDDRAMLWAVDDVHGNELSAEGQHVQLSTKRLVLLKHLNREKECVCGGGGGLGRSCQLS